MTRIEPENGISAGVQLKATGAGMVPLQEEHEARLERGYTLEQWLALDVFERALVIAIRRNRNSISNLQADAEIRKARNDAKKKA